MPTAEPQTEFDQETLENGRLLFAGECTFLIGAVDFNLMPESQLPEVTFAGRSNVGKSSLINKLTGRKNLARTSNTPGRTQEINFFDLGGRLMLADLPGYGYAKAPKARVDQWTDLVMYYLRARVQLRRVCLLIDARHGLKDNDRDAMKLMDQAAVSYQIVLTKSDKIKAGPLAKLLDRTYSEIKTHVAAHPEIIVTSATKNTGIAELRAALGMLANPD